MTQKSHYWAFTLKKKTKLKKKKHMHPSVHCSTI